MGDDISHHLSRDSFLCACRACRTFYPRKFGEYAHLITMSQKSDAASQQESVESKSQANPALKYGSRVLVHGRYSGIVKFIGPLDNDLISPRIYVGVHLDDNIGSTHNGIFKGKRYFHCPRGHGAIVRLNHVQLMPRPNSRPPLHGNYMFPSYREILHTRRIRSIEDPDCGFSAPYGNKGRNRRSSTSGSVSSVEGSTLKRPRQSPARLHKVVFSSPSHSTEWDPFQSSSKETEQWNMSGHSEPRTVYLPRSPHMQSSDPALDQELEKWRREFGGGDRANQLVETLRKLHLAYREGLETKDQENKD